ncbi:unknown [Prevotella sp. CAG:873]|nr:unknown [Prevotella sp. CAG:873]
MTSRRVAFSSALAYEAASFCIISFTRPKPSAITAHDAAIFAPAASTDFCTFLATFSKSDSDIVADLMPLSSYTVLKFIVIFFAIFTYYWSICLIFNW